MGGEDLHRGCARAREWASLRLDGELSELERLLLRRHLARCVGCRAFAETSAAATALMRRAPLERPSRRIEVLPAAAPARRRKHGRLAAALAAALAVGAAVGGGVVASSDDDGPAPRPTITIVQVPDPPPTTLTQPGENV